MEFHSKSVTFLGMSSQLMRFIRNFNQISATLSALTSTKISFSWNRLAQRAFDELKSCFISVPVLSISDPEQQFIVKVDASAVGVCAVLSQRSPKDGRVHPCSYYWW